MRKKLHIAPWGVIPVGMAEKEEQVLWDYLKQGQKKLANEKWRLIILLSCVCQDLLNALHIFVF